ncbi:DUF1499 domain-containing protein [Aggregicoccus sp. 17bor-14]|uniref:DUF1499 domain-containing protein n=1 Tax=Myxococcaceae TaxID=31 RepID=UPI00129D17B5|nr:MULTISPECIES: DUF1499 domain-containing protein [Myxococcaceae]MBF5043259.1 DUF1499 domain-containing protein [Simulacricoccus sp. 17bor-14]MRI89016.1 DUF1499 domain-containing protein [Aggregicoccus sp. 17bor-14]
MDTPADTAARPTGPRWPRAVPLLGLALAALALLLVALPGPLYRHGLLELRAGFTSMQYGAWTALAAFALCVLGLVLARLGPARGRGRWALLGLVLAAPAFALPSAFRSRARAVPPIHDISTDTGHPPAFVAVLPLRSGAANPAEYGGPEVARQQHAAYPELKPLALKVPRAEAFQRALEAARAEGWEVVATEPTEGRIEATDTTFWWGFKDDVVVRVAQGPGGGSVVDVRSVSRVGRSDVGKNAARIRGYLRRLMGG